MNKQFLKYKEQEKIVHVVDDDEEIYLQDDECDNNMNLDGVD